MFDGSQRTAAVNAARDFISGYLRQPHGGPGPTLERATAALRQELRHHAWRATPAQQDHPARDQQLGLTAQTRASPRALATARADGRPPHRPLLHRPRRDERSLLTRIGDAN